MDMLAKVAHNPVLEQCLQASCSGSSSATTGFGFGIARTCASGLRSHCNVIPCKVRSCDFAIRAPCKKAIDEHKKCLQVAYIV